jgi:hypothetical protein
MRPPSTPKGGCRHEAPAPIGQKAQPATDRRSLEKAQAVTANEGRGLRSALTPPIEVSIPPLHPGGFFFCSCRARRSASPPSPAAGFEVRPIPSAGKISSILIRNTVVPTAVRTVFERPGG